MLYIQQFEHFVNTGRRLFATVIKADISGGLAITTGLTPGELSQAGYVGIRLLLRPEQDNFVGEESASNRSQHGGGIGSARCACYHNLISRPRGKINGDHQLGMS